MRRIVKPCLGFTLVELLVVIAIIAMLVTLLLPAVQAAREAARKTQCINNLKQIGLALNNYQSAHQKFPYGADDDDCEVSRDRNPLTWRVLILPFNENQAIYDQAIVVAEQSITRGCYPVRAWEKSLLQQQVIDGYVCPSESGSPIKSGFSTWSGPNPAAIASYFGNAGPASTGPPDWGMPNVCGKCTDGTKPDAFCPCFLGGPDRGFYYGQKARGPGMLDMYPNELSIQHVPDGTSKTLFVGETHWSPGEGAPGCKEQMQWMSSWCVSSSVWGINAADATDNWWGGCNWRSRHVGGANFVMVDGSVHFLEDTINLVVLANLATRNDGNVGATYRPKLQL